MQSLTSLTALAALLSIALPATATPNVNVDWDCQATPPIGSATQLSLGSTIDGTAPADVGPGDIFEILLAAKPQTVPTQAAGYKLNNLRNVKLLVPVPAGTSFKSVSLTGGVNVNSNPSIAQSNGVLTLSVPGPISGGASFTFPAIHLSVSASGAPGSGIQSHVAGTSYADPGLQFTANVHISPGIDIDVPARCFPKGGASPVLTSTAIDQPGAAPATRYGPALASSANRTAAVAVTADGRVQYTWWDLGGGGNGWRDLPGISSDTSPGVSLVQGGNYAFVLAKAVGGAVYLNQGTPGGSAWVGWQSSGFTSNVGPAAAASGDRSMSLVIGTDGRVMYDWWDLGGGGHGWKEIPGGFRTVTSGAVALVSKGTYAFVLARDGGGNLMLNQGNPTTNSWVGWQSMNFASNVAPAASSSQDRSVAVVISTDGRVMYDWWDLGGGGHGWKEIPGGFRTDASVGVGFVANGRYAFVLAKDTSGKMWLNQGDPTTGVWVGWR
ncbi:hypothetical protein QBC47DRAFT_443903 [Echria macrotheca]|uniref:Uncharacterized protein n=1 Tax=Echria macrotheca TaxID=438768 RepID=A0AAJ0F6P7_9PEZI|nr:hypothetical protein QBC47DRAFT_443903 [Echria macrotheca]